MTIRPVAARILIALVVVNAAAGVTALVVSSDKQIGSFEGHIFLTTLAASMAAFTILPCLLSYERGLAKPLAGLGIAASLVTLGVLVTLIWTDNPPDDLWSSTVSAAAVSLGLALVNLLTLATLPRSNEWVRLAAYALTALTAAQVIAVVWNDDPSDARLRVLAATAIVLAASGVLAPILQRMAGDEVNASQPAVRYCPNCGSRIVGEGKTADCHACGARFSIRFE
jgi:hypothetical protein